MVERQLRQRGISDDRVLRAMEEVPRERFLPPELRKRAYHDGAIGIGAGQTMSQPWIVACMTSLLELGGDERVLEVGTGSGYGAAVISRCAREVKISAGAPYSWFATAFDFRCAVVEASISTTGGTQTSSRPTRA